MIKIVGNDIWRAGQKIGYLQSNDIYDARGEKAGYFIGDDVYDRHGKKLGYLEGEYVKTVLGERIRISDNRRAVQGGSASDVARAAVRLLFGAGDQ